MHYVTPIQGAFPLMSIVQGIDHEPGQDKEVPEDEWNSYIKKMLLWKFLEAENVIYLDL